MLESVKSLRGYVDACTDRSVALTTMPPQYRMAYAPETLESYLREVEREVGERCVRLPLDADGVPIRVGDVVGRTGHGRFEVRSMSLDADGWVVHDGLGHTHGPVALRHRREPTVEDVLREFTDAVLEWAKKSGTVAETGTWSDVAAEYVAKLRLAEGDE